MSADMQTVYDVLVIGGNADAMVLATSLAESGKKTIVLETAMKAGGELLTESFLSSHRYNLVGGWQLADSLATLPIGGFAENNKRLLLPEIPLAFLFDKQEALVFDRSFRYLHSQLLHADKKPLSALMDAGKYLYAQINTRFSSSESTLAADKGKFSNLMNKNVKQVLDDFGFKEARLRCALSCLPLILGYDIEYSGSGAMLAYLLFALGKLSVVDGGSGLLLNSLRDKMASRGAMLVESARMSRVDFTDTKLKSVHLEDGRVFSASVIVFAKGEGKLQELRQQSASQQSDTESAIYRIYLDFKRSPSGFNTSEAQNAILRKAYMVGFGFNREEDVYHYLKMIKVGQPPFVAGHLINNSFLDINKPVGALAPEQGKLWCTSCHSRDAATLRKQAGNFPTTNISMQPDMLAGERFYETDSRDFQSLKSPSQGRPSHSPHKDDDSVLIRPTPVALIWQGVLARRVRTFDLEGFRKAFEDACVRHITRSLAGIEESDIRFRLTWLAEETNETLLQTDVSAMLLNESFNDAYIAPEKGVFIDPYARLARYTGMRSGQKLVSILQTT